MSEIIRPDNPPTYSREASRDFLLDPRSYARFDLTKDFRIPIACAEPRNEARTKRILTAIQEPGGGAGEAQDRAIEETIFNGFQVVTTEDAFIREMNERGTIVLGGHTRCKFVTANEAVLQEEVAPSDFTLHNFHESLRKYRIAEDVLPLMPAIFHSAKVQLEYVQEAGAIEDLVDLIDQSYTNHANVAHVHGENQAEIYIENHHPHVGLNRDNKAKRRDHGIDIQGYHESRAAAYDDLIRHNNRRGASKIATGYRVGAFFLRSAASRTVLGSLRPNTEFWKITQGENGLLMERQEDLN